MDLSQKTTLHVEVVYALAHRQLIVALEVPAGATVREAALLSGLDKHFEGLDLAACPLGIFGDVVDPNRTAVEGDRIELYRPLQVDPKEVRRRLAAEGRSMGAARDQDSASTTRSTTSPSK